MPGGCLAPTPDAFVRIDSLWKSFPRRRGWRDIVTRPFSRERLPVLRGLSLSVGRGEFFGLLGPNGAGKSTLFRILATLIEPDEGAVHIGGADVRSDPAAARRQLAIVTPDERSLFWRLTAAENLRLFASLYGQSGVARTTRVSEILRLVGLAEAANRMVGTFSSGMKQRLLIGRALLAEPDVLLLDEPTRSLDPITARDLRRFIRTELVERRGCTVLLATHDSEEALELCDRLAVLHMGRLVATGTVDELAGIAGRTRIRLTVRADQLATVREVVDRWGGEVAALTDAGNAGWTPVSIAGGDTQVDRAALLALLVTRGVDVAAFSAESLALAELVERIVAREESA